MLMGGTALDDPYRFLRSTAAVPGCDCEPALPIALGGGGQVNPMTCVGCCRSVAPESVGPPEQLSATLANWCRLASAFHEIRMNSRSSENRAWAERELGRIDSEINSRGLELRRALDPLRRCYYWWHAEPRGAPLCPSCGQSLRSRDAPAPRRLACNRCSIIVPTR